MKIKITLIIAFFISVGCIKAQDFSIDGVNYTITDATNMNVEIGVNSCYSGDLNLQSTAINNGITYTITSIADYAFSTCTSLTSVTLPNTITEVATGAFNYSGLVSVNLPNTITSINFRAFERCENLETINLPNSITTIEERAFERCEKLNNVNLPISLTSIGKEAFVYCRALTQITIPNTITVLNEGVFDSCENLTTVNLPSNLITIGDNAFNYNISLTNISAFPTTLKTIGEHAFEGSALSVINIPSSVTSIGNSAFSECEFVTSVTLSEGLTSIGARAFDNCKKLTSITIPESVTFLDEYVLDGCTLLENVTLPSTLLRLENGFFKECTSLKNINLPNNVNYIGFSTFEESGLESIIIPNSVTIIENSAFRNCSSLTSITISENISSIENSVFRECTSLTEITIPDNVENIYDYAFRGCSSLETINFPSNLKKITLQAFMQCSTLTKIDLPKSITEIQYGAFTNTNLSEVIVNWDSPYEPNLDIFVTTDITSATLKVPINTKSLYQNVSPWKDFGTITEGGFIGSDFTAIPDAEFEQYLVQNNIDSDGTINGKVLTTDVSGVTQLFPKNQNISDLTGIQAFTSLIDLEVDGNNLTSINLTQNTQLEHLLLGSNQLTNVDLSQNTLLNDVSVSGNQLTSIDLSKNTVLKELFLGGNMLTNLDISKNLDLTYLAISDNQLTTLDVSKNEKIINLNCSKNNFATLDISKLIDLEILDISENKFVTIDVSKNVKLKNFTANKNELTELDFSKNLVLETMVAWLNKLTLLNAKNGNNNAITDFEAQQNPDLVCIKVDDADYSRNNADWTKDSSSNYSEICYEGTLIPDDNFEAYIESQGWGNGITGDNYVNTNEIKTATIVDVSDKNITDLTGLEEFTALINFEARNNTITSIDVSNNLNLEVLNIFSNSITSLDVSNNTKLKELHVGTNLLEGLDISMLTDLTKLWCFNNYISSIDVSKNTELTLLNSSNNQIVNLDLNTNTKLSVLYTDENLIQVLDLSNNSMLTELTVTNNKLVSLDVKNGNNTNVTAFFTTGNSSLTCIKVDDENYSETTWNDASATWNAIDSQTSFNTNCPKFTSIPDNNFEAYLESINVGNGVVGDNLVNTELIEVLTSLNINRKEISDLTGIKDFTNLKTLFANNNNLSLIDVSENVLLEEIEIAGTQINTIDFSNNISLKKINVSGNALTEINTTTLINLEDLVFNENQIAALNLETNIKLKSLYGYDNKLTNIDLSKNAELIFVDIDDNNLTAVNLKNGNNTGIAVFSVTGNPNLTCVEVDDVSHFTNTAASVSVDSQTQFYANCPSTTVIPDINFEAYLESINVGNGIVGDGLVITPLIEEITNLNIESKNISDLTGLGEFKKLLELNAKNNNIAQIDLSKNILLEVLNLENNQLTNIDLSKNFSLKNLNVGDNQISTLDVYFLTELESLQCYKNQISTINLVSNKKLLAFVANDNQLQIVDVRVNTDLTWLDVDDNDLVSLTVKNGNNAAITSFSATGNVNLTCIEVDDVSYSETNWAEKDAGASFSGDCAPANDDCSFAIPLVFGQQTPGDINSGNFTNATDCVAGTIIADVWFSVTVPDTGEFSIEGSGFGGLLKFAIYESCSSTSALTCGLNLSLTGLTPGDVYYLKVWMESSTSSRSTNSESGTFTLTANNTSVLSVDDINVIESDFQLYPNPTSTFVNIKAANNSEIKLIEIYNLLGKKVLTKRIKNNSETRVNTSKFSSGIYFLKAKVDNKVVSKKLIIK